MIENECKTPYGCLKFTFYQKYFFMIKRVSYINFLSKIFFTIKWTKAFLFSCDDSCQYFLRLSSVNFTWSILEYFAPYHKHWNIQRWLQNRCLKTFRKSPRKLLVRKKSTSLVDVAANFTRTKQYKWGFLDHFQKFSKQLRWKTIWEISAFGLSASKL